MLVPVWRRDCYHLRGNYCSWDCAKADVLAKAKGRAFPDQVTALALFAFQISFRGHHCPSRERLHPVACLCPTRFTGVPTAPPKETLQAFGGHTSIDDFRSHNLTIESYSWVTRFYSPRDLTRTPRNTDRKYFYTLQPIRKTIVLADVEDDPIVLIKRRVF